MPVPEAREQLRTPELSDPVKFFAGARPWFKTIRTTKFNVFLVIVNFYLHFIPSRFSIR